jgi:hypothetical protein
VDELINLIKEDDKWFEPEAIEVVWCLNVCNLSKNV